jgi:signal peptidase
VYPGVNPRRLASGALTLLLALVLGSLLLGSLLGQPVLLGFVETGSMAPTLAPGDGFVAVPTAVDDDIEEGDVVVFHAKEVDGGGLTTHRVVDETEEGYVTKGDANPVTDQDGAEPPVQRGQIKATALQVGGEVVVVPKLGGAVVGVQDAIAGLQRRLAVITGTRSLLGTQGLAYLLFGVGVLAYAASVLFARGDGRERRERTREDGTVDYRLLLIGLTVVLVAAATAGMTLGGGTQELAVVSSSSDAPGVGVIPTGERENTTYTVPGAGVMPAVVFLEPGSDRIDVTPREVYVPPGETANATVTIEAPESTGYYPQYLTEYRYPGVLPRETIRALYGIHPWAPIVVIDALLAIGFLGLGAALLGTGPVRVRTRESPTVLARIRRWLR